MVRRTAPSPAHGRRAGAAVTPVAEAAAPAASEPGILPLPPSEGVSGLTGRYLVLVDQDNVSGAERALRSSASLELFSVAGESALSLEQPLEVGQGVVFPDLGVAVVKAAPDQLKSVGAAVARGDTLHIMEPERFVYAIGDVDLAYLRGYRDAVNHLFDQLSGAQPGAPDVMSAADESALSWGLQATNTGNSGFSGKGIRIAVLDTGVDLKHPDFTGRTLDTQSFIDGQTVQDGNGHGTHCCGVASGPRRPQRLPRFAVAPEAELFVGKVLNDAGRGADANIIAGLQWALARKCDIISMSLGAAVAQDQPYSRIFQQIGERALARGSLIVAAAGNDSRRRSGVIAPVSHPANCPSIMAVAAVDRAGAVADFSNGGLRADGKVDLSAPGVDVVSTWPLPGLYKSLDGTSMATPHVAGIAALFAESSAAARGSTLWALLLQHARPLAASSRDVGAGLVQAP